MKFYLFTSKRKEKRTIKEFSSLKYYNHPFITPTLKYNVVGEP